MRPPQLVALRTAAHVERRFHLVSADRLALPLVIDPYLVASRPGKELSRIMAAMMLIVMSGDTSGLVRW